MTRCNPRGRAISHRPQPLFPPPIFCHQRHFITSFFRAPSRGCWLFVYSFLVLNCVGGYYCRRVEGKRFGPGDSLCFPAQKGFNKVIIWRVVRRLPALGGSTNTVRIRGFVDDCFCYFSLIELSNIFNF